MMNFKTSRHRPTSNRLDDIHRRGRRDRRDRREKKIIFDKPSVFSAFFAVTSISFNYSIFGQKTRVFYRIMDNFRKMTLNILKILP